MKILYFASTAFYRKPNPSFHLMTAMIQDILFAGHEVNYVGPQLKGLYKHIPDDLINHPNFHYSLVYRKTTEKSNFILRYLRGIKYALDSRRFISNYSKESDIIFIQSSFTALYNILVARRICKTKIIVYNVQDMVPGSSIASGVLSNRILQKIFFSLQKYAYKYSDVIVAISDDMKLKLIEQGVSPNKIRVIVNWYDDTSVKEIAWENNRFVKKHQMQHDKFYVQYAGTMGYVFDYKIVVRVAEILKDYRNIQFQMIGAGSQKDAFVKLVRDKELCNVHFLPLEPQNMVSDVYSACSVCFIPLKHGVIGNSVPSKAGLLMACKRPIITSVDEGCEYAKEINNNGIGIACPDNNPHDIANAILRLYNNPKMALEMGKRGYNYGYKKYSRFENMKLYLMMFEEIYKYKL